ncbi:MAG: hypothetical protein GKR95_04305 [Gammaproteobacteria bacterium]|nr:hypothetical protein [Gammaproteobacteria bacterium]
MYPLIIPAVLLFGGFYFLGRNISFLRNQIKLGAYLETNPAGKRWVKHFGQEKAIELFRRYFLPVGIVIALAMIWVGCWGTYKVLLQYLQN